MGRFPLMTQEASSLLTRSALRIFVHVLRRDEPYLPLAGPPRQNSCRLH